VFIEENIRCLDHFSFNAYREALMAYSNKPRFSEEVGVSLFLKRFIFLLRAYYVTMEDEKKTKKQLIEELNELRQCVADCLLSSFYQTRAWRMPTPQKPDLS
jgi:hypothetical protein